MKKSYQSRNPDKNIGRELKMAEKLGCRNRGVGVSQKEIEKMFQKNMPKGKREGRPDCL